MKRIFLSVFILSVLLLSVFLASAAVVSYAAGENSPSASLPTTDVSYYADNAPGIGDLEYRAERCTLDIAVPQGAAADQKLPVIVWFHGGGLSGGNKFIVREFVEHGIIVVAVNYRLRTKAKNPDFTEDAAAAVAWTFAHIADYGGDVKRIYVSGHSAGGYLTMMVGMAPQYLAAYGLKNTDIAGLYPISGQATTHFNIVADRNAQQGIPKDPKQTRDNPVVVDEFAPLYYTNQIISPIHFLCGDPAIEWPARVEENALTAAMLKTVRGHNTVEIRSFSGCNHGSCAQPSYEYIWKSICGEKP